MVELILNSDGGAEHSGLPSYETLQSMEAFSALLDQDEPLYSDALRLRDVSETNKLINKTTDSGSSKDVQSHRSSTLANRSVSTANGKACSERRTSSAVRSRQVSRLDLGTPATSRCVCHVCGDILSVPKSLRRHMETVHRDRDVAGQAPIYCSICCRNYSRRDVFLRHEEYQHRRGKVKCAFCGKAIAERALRGHLRSSPCEAIRAMQAIQDSKQIQSFRFAATIFTLDSVLDPLVTCSRLLFCWSYVPEKGRSRHLPKALPLFSRAQLRPQPIWDRQDTPCSTYWQLRDLTMRTIMRGLSDRIQAASCAFAIALLAMSLLDLSVGLSSNTALYNQILRSNWTLQRYNEEVENLKEALRCAFSVNATNEQSRQRCLAFRANLVVVRRKFSDVMLCLPDRPG